MVKRNNIASANMEGVEFMTYTEAINQTLWM